MRSSEYIVHGTASEKDAEGIQEAGFRAEEGRATVSTNLEYAFGWATEQERRRGSKSESEIEEGEVGRIIVMRTPADMASNYATHSDVEVNDDEKTISGYPSKYISGRKQLALYDREGDPIEKKNEIEAAKSEIASIEQARQNFLAAAGLDAGRIHSKQDLMALISDREPEDQIRVLREMERTEAAIRERKNVAERHIEIPQENIMLSIKPTKELGTEMEKIKAALSRLEKPDLNAVSQEVGRIIKETKGNYVAKDTNVDGAVRTLLESTVESIVMNKMRSLSMDVKRARGYRFEDRGDVKIPERSADKEEIRKKLTTIQETVTKEGFDIGSEALNRYIKMNIERLLRELDLPGEEEPVELD